MVVGAGVGVPKDVQLIEINKYLEKLQNEPFFYFCYKCIKIHCSLDNPIHFHLLMGKPVLGIY